MSRPYVGVDEAGKGPVLGPMVAAAVRAEPAALPDGVDDSKRLSAERRASIAADLRGGDRIGVAVGVVSVAEIDAPGTDMNGLTLAAQARAVRGVTTEGDRVVADAGDVSAERFGRRLDDRLAGAAAAHSGEGTAPEFDPVDVAVDAAHGADESDPVVGAASVVAKVERDRRVVAIDERHDRDVGSGYPSDPTTRSFLAGYVDEHRSLPDCARTSWATAEDILQAAEQSSLAEF